MKNIALAMSGGGYRAAAFALGTLSYLNHLKDDEDQALLTRVSFMSSTSGGSITNIAYSAGICNEDDFDVIYHRLINAIDGEKVIEKVFLILADDEAWKQRPQKSRNLINAFSMAYDELLYPEQYFGIYTDKLPNTHLEEICVNATELANGMSFRFQSQSRVFTSGKIGNFYIKFTNTEVAGELKLADILASSSCFPGGFEPLVFPDDYTHAGLNAERLDKAISYKDNPFTTEDNPDDLLSEPAFKENYRRFGMLDGGIADNQAIDSILRASERRENAHRTPFDLLLITDVTSYLIDGYTLPMEKKGIASHLNVNGITWALFLFGILSPLMVGISLFCGWHQWMYLLFIPSTISIVTWGYLQYQLTATRLKANRERSTWSLILLAYGSFFLKLRLSALTQMLTARLKSVMLITSDVYLKQIRRHYYNQLYDDPATRDLVVANAIYDLSLAKQRMTTDLPPEQQERQTPEKAAAEKLIAAIAPPSNALIGVAENARLMATTLWFDKYQRRDNAKEAIVATGQFTVCYNLLKHLFEKQVRIRKTDPAYVPDAQETVLMTNLQTHWKAFNADPFWLYNQIGKNQPDFCELKAIPGKLKYNVISKTPIR
jgi:hypothetical protein